MFRPHFVLTALLAASAIAAPSLQERAKKKEVKDFPAVLTEARSAWESESFGACSQALAEASKLLAVKRRASILAAFPAPGEGWTFKADEVDAAAAAMMSGFAGTVIEGNYRGPERARLGLQAMVDSPMVQMMSMMIANPAMMGEDAELITYGKYKAVLQKNSRLSFELTIVVGDDVIKADSNGITDDELLKIMSQETVDKLAAAMAR